MLVGLAIAVACGGVERFAAPNVGGIGEIADTSQNAILGFLHIGVHTL